MRIKILFIVAWASLAGALFGAERPNIVVILADDQGYGDIGLYGSPDARTPRLDAFAAEAVRFDDFHAAPVCAPTRASLMTGKQFLRAGVWGVHGGRDYLDLGETTVAEVLRDAGYDTAMLGKWHLGKTAAYLPYNRGFNESWSITDRLYMHTDPVIDHSGVELRPKGWTAEYLTDRAIEWMTRDREGPFFLYLAHPYIHEPYYAPESMIQVYRNLGHSESYARLLAMNEHLDAEVGRFLDALTANVMSENTVVWYLGDNGPIGNPVNVPHLTEAEMARRNPQGLKGVKGNLYENGHRVGSFVRWGSRFPKRVDAVEADVTDVVPTLLELAGVEDARLSMDGASLAGRLKGNVEWVERERVYANHQAIWPGRERLYDFLGDKNSMRFEDQVLAIRLGRFKWVQGYGRRELYDLEADPQESRNVAGAFPEIAADLERRLGDWWQSQVKANAAGYAMPVFPLDRSDERGKGILLHGGAPSLVFGDVTPGSHHSHDWMAVGDGVAWRVTTEKGRPFSVSVEVERAQKGAELELRIGERAVGRARLGEPGRSFDFGEVDLAAGAFELGVVLVKCGDEEDEAQIGVVKWARVW